MSAKKVASVVNITAHAGAVVNVDAKTISLNPTSAKTYGRSNPDLFVNIPKRLTALRQWVCWRSEPRENEKPAKIPVCPMTGKNASHSDPSTWGTFNQAIAAFHKNPKLAGIGFVFSAEDPFTGVDIDDCRDRATGTLDKRAQQIVEILATYGEVSPSGTGVKLIVEATAPGPASRRQNIEIYSHSRYFTLTGEALNDHPNVEARQGELADVYREVFGAPNFTQQPAPDDLAKWRAVSDEKIIELVCASKPYRHLWHHGADGDGSKQNHSEQDFKLLCRLARFTNRDAERMERLFTSSKLGQREKWLRRGDYRAATIRKVIEKMQEVWDPDSGSLPEEAELKDALIAERFAAAEGENLQYCFEMNSWLVWDARRWKVDQQLRARTLMERMMRALVQERAKTGTPAALKGALRLFETRQITNALYEAQKRLVVNAEDLDADPWLLTFTNGTLDLRSGDLEPFNPEHRITKMVHHAYNPVATCPRYLEFLEHAVGAAGASYLQKAVGYSLVGNTSEKKFFLLAGEGDTGKTTFLEIWRTILKEHSVLIQIDTLMERKGGDSAAQEDLVALRGVRFATTSELDRGKRLSVAQVKRIVQGMGMITAAAKYQRKITFPETHKLWIDTNNLPIIPANEQALWNRLVIVKFENPVAKDRQNKKLRDELIDAEAEGIIAWAVEGERRRQQEGLDDVPEVFTREKTQWRDKMDVIEQFLHDCCERKEGFVTPRQLTYHAYVSWIGNYPMSPRAFTEELQEKGITRNESRTHYQGIKLKESAYLAGKTDSKNGAEI